MRIATSAFLVVAVLLLPACSDPAPAGATVIRAARLYTAPDQAPIDDEAASRTGLAAKPQPAQAVPMRRPFRALTTLLLIAVLHNGVATPSTAAPDHALPADAGMTHHRQDGGDCSAPNCCDPSSCDCGCTATPTSMPRLAPAARGWAQTAVFWAEDAARLPRGPTGAPFRPPA